MKQNQPYKKWLKALRKLDKDGKFYHKINDVVHFYAGKCEPEEAYYSIVISELLWDRYMLALELDNKTLEEIQSDLMQIKPMLEYTHDKRMAEDEDWRSGYDTYGYNDLDSIKYQLGYISDRWNAAFRLRWLLDLIDLEV